MTFGRFAIYHLPAGPLGDFGSAWLGWDARAGRAVQRPQIAGLPDSAESLTSAPARYGFHATLKAPFRLAQDHDAKDAIRRAQTLCDGLPPFALKLELRQDWGFVALRPKAPPLQLAALEQALVTRLDDLRAPLSPQERDRRRPEALPEQARTHLDRWGYPFVLDLFQYHLTLSNALPPRQAQVLCAAFAPLVAPLIADPVPVETVALVGEDAQGRFHLIREFALRG